jgi:membrane associated rhomboid family serine protease
MTGLKTVRQLEGMYFACGLCGGRAVTLPQIRHRGGDQFATGLLRKINNATEASPLSCPFCFRRMKRFQITDPTLTLDACRPCNLVWFDPGEFEAVPEPEPVVVVEPPHELAMRGKEILANYKLDQLSQQIRQEQTVSGNPPDEEWKWVPAFFGLPVKLENEGLTDWPWLTFSLATIIALVSILAFFDLETAVRRFALIPDEVWRYGGLTLLTSFFLHGGVWHLVSNLYFFLLFGGKVEDYLGRCRFALLILSATLAGNCLHVLFDPHSSTPCIGASGGIAGIIAFYALEFPRARLGFLFRFYYWVNFPAWGALVLWLLLQIWGAGEQIAGFSKVSSLAHLGGAGAGFAAWWYWRKLALQPG